MSEEKMLRILTTNWNRRLISQYTNGHYQEFAVYFDYHSDIPDQFTRVLTYFEQCKGICPEGHLEKSEVRWFKLSDIIEDKISQPWGPSFHRMLLEAYPYLIEGISKSTLEL